MVNMFLVISNKKWCVSTAGRLDIYIDLSRSQ